MINFVNQEENWGDVFTKSLPLRQFVKSVDSIIAVLDKNVIITLIETP